MTSLIAKAVVVIVLLSGTLLLIAGSWASHNVHRVAVDALPQFLGSEFKLDANGNIVKVNRWSR